MFIPFHLSTFYKNSRALEMVPGPLTLLPKTHKVYVPSPWIWEGLVTHQLIECGRSDVMYLLKRGHKVPCSFPWVAWNTWSLNVPPPNTAVMLGEVQATERGHVQVLLSVVHVDTAIKSPQPGNQTFEWRSLQMIQAPDLRHPQPLESSPLRPRTSAE